MSSYDDRLAALEQTSVTRVEFTKAMDNLTWQQGHILRDRNHETAIVLGVLTDDVRVIKENVASMRIRMNEGFADLNQELYGMQEKFEKRFVALETRFDSMEARFEKRFVALETRLDSMETRFDALEAKFNEQTSLLKQILARLS